ncbi:MAG: methyltransferase domain-containing protein [Planctomycetes bacterium]|nr:methyltransferase domain-containing protein [Planctomycetota bacterium]
MAKDKSLWDEIYLKGPEAIRQKAQFDWFSAKAYSEYRRWIGPDDKKVLDAGFGTGRFCFALAKDLPHSEVVGIDISPNLVEDATNAAAVLGLTNVTFTQASIFSLPFADGAFDVVFNEGVIEHLDYEAAVREMVRVTKPGGKVVIGVPNWYCFPHTLRKALIRLLGLKFEYDVEKSFRHSELRDLLARNGLTCIETTGYYPLQSVIRLFWVTKIAQVLWRLQPVFDVCEKMLRMVETHFISIVDAATRQTFSTTFGFEIVARGIKPPKPGRLAVDGQLMAAAG